MYFVITEIFAFWDAYKECHEEEGGFYSLTNPCSFCFLSSVLICTLTYKFKLVKTEVQRQWKYLPKEYLYSFPSPKSVVFHLRIECVCVWVCVGVCDSNKEDNIWRNTL